MCPPYSVHRSVNYIPLGVVTSYAPGPLWGVGGGGGEEMGMGYGVWGTEEGGWGMRGIIFHRGGDGGGGGFLTFFFFSSRGGGGSPFPLPEGVHSHFSPFFPISRF